MKPRKPRREDTIPFAPGAKLFANEEAELAFAYDFGRLMGELYLEGKLDHIFTPEVLAGVAPLPTPVAPELPKRSRRGWTSK